MRRGRCIPGRSARNHLLFLAETQGFAPRRVDEVLDLVGLRAVARKRVGGFSLGMTQRLGIAAAMLGNPAVLLLDEPVNGLDPEGIRWVRTLMRQLASEGRTVFVSSHLMSEMAVTADHLIVIGRGKLIAESSTNEFIQRSSDRSVLVRTPDADAARQADRLGGRHHPARRRLGQRERHGRPGRERRRRRDQHRGHRAARAADRGARGLGVGGALRADTQAGLA